MKKVYLGVVLTIGLQYCLSFEEKIYTPPTQIQNVLILPFVEEDQEEKTFLEKKASPYFYLGFGFAHNVHQLMNQSQEIHSVPLNTIAQDTNAELLLKTEKEVLELWKTSNPHNIKYLVFGSFKVVEKEKFKIVVKVYNLENLENKKIKSKLLTLQEVSKGEDSIEYTKFLKTELYPDIIKFILCFKVMKESCVPIQQEELENLDLEETKSFSEFLDHSRGLYHFYEFIHFSDNKFERIKEQQFSEIYFKKAIFSSKEKGVEYNNAIRNFISFQKNSELQKEALNLDLSKFQVFYKSSNDPLKPELDQEEASNLRTLLNKSLRFVKENPEYKIFVTGIWSKQLENKDQLLRSTSLIEFLYGKQDFNSESSPYIFEDISGEEDSSKLEIRKVTGGN